MTPNEPSETTCDRRALLGAGLASAVAIGGASEVQAEANTEPGTPALAITHGHIRQSVMGWCFQPMTPLALAQHCQAIGLVAMEGIPRETYGAVRELGLQIALVGSHSFQSGPVSRDHHAEVIDLLRSGIDAAVEYGAPHVITFTGMREPGMSDRQAMANCVECWKQVIDYAESNNVNLCLEHLNSRDDSHPMKGHPGYFGDDVERCVDLIRKVDSPRMKLLFDIYHVQVMHGDVIRRLRQYQHLIGHYHTAGNPGRGELDETQEINYPAVMRAILETGYTGYVAQEFIPTWNDPIAALRHAAGVCDVTPSPS